MRLNEVSNKTVKGIIDTLIDWEIEARNVTAKDIENALEENGDFIEEEGVSFPRGSGKRQEMVSKYLRLVQSVDEWCLCCKEELFLEVCHSDLNGNEKWRIEACLHCNAFSTGSMGDVTQADKLAQEAAKKDGYILDNEGFII